MATRPTRCQRLILVPGGRSRDCRLPPRYLVTPKKPSKAKAHCLCGTHAKTIPAFWATVTPLERK
jgi:hypothetical protein